MMGSRDDARERDGRWRTQDEQVGWSGELDRDWRALGDGRYAIWVAMPWGVEVPALAVVSSVWGWPKRVESRDPRWTAFAIGPAVVAIRLIGGMRERDQETEPCGIDPVADDTPYESEEGGSGCPALEATSLPAA